MPPARRRCPARPAVRRLRPKRGPERGPVRRPHSDRPQEGALEVAVEMPALCSKLTRPGRPSPESHWLTERVAAVLRAAGTVDLTQLCIKEATRRRPPARPPAAPCGSADAAARRGGLQAQAAWVLRLDVYCLNADGALLSTALLAAAGALLRLRLPAVTLGAKWRVALRPSPPTDGEAAAAGGAQPGGAAAEVAAAEGGPVSIEARRLQLGPLPVALACGLFRGTLLVDPTLEEEAVMETVITIATDPAGRLARPLRPAPRACGAALLSRGSRADAAAAPFPPPQLLVHKPGGAVGMSEATLADCLEAARRQQRAVAKQLQAAAGGDEAEEHRTT